MKRLLFLIALLLGFGSCKKFLDIVPDNVPTIESAFTLRSTAERHLFTCYSWLPDAMNMSTDPGAGYWGGEFWGNFPNDVSHAFMYARGDQGVTNPRLDYWSGLNGGKAMFQGIRDCNVFLANVGKVPDITPEEKNRWIAEVKVLKAYYHFFLLRMYGPFPMMKENLPISASPEEVQRPRDSTEDIFAYIIELIDESIAHLPAQIFDLEGELGRITAPSAVSMKAKILLTQASPLYNGNPDYVNFKDKQGKNLFSITYDANKWKIAADAAKTAIDLCHSVGVKLYYYEAAFGAFAISDTTKTQLNIRNSFSERWNVETIWADPNHAPGQGDLTPFRWDPAFNPGSVTFGTKYAPSIEYTELFYTENGVPIDEDKTWDYQNRFKLQVASQDDRYNISIGYTVPKMHFKRENRFYASLGFDGGIWYGQGRFNDNDTWTLQAKFGQPAGFLSANVHSETGYFPKKRVNWQNVTSGSNYSVTWYPAPIIRLADLYLIYAEALNEFSGPSSEIYEYLNLIRARAGLPTVQDSWTNYSINPAKHTSKDGLRSIIHREREVELSFEAQRFWDIKRWKRAMVEFSKPISGWSIMEAATDNYYQKKVIYQPQFNQRNYLDVIRESVILNNPNLVQNPGW